MCVPFWRVEIWTAKTAPLKAPTVVRRLFAVATSFVVKLEFCLKVAIAKVAVRELSIEKNLICAFQKRRH